MHAESLVQSRANILFWSKLTWADTQWQTMVFDRLKSDGHQAGCSQWACLFALYRLSMIEIMDDGVKLWLPILIYSVASSFGTVVLAVQNRDHMCYWHARAPQRGQKHDIHENVIYTCIHMYMKLRIECDYQASLHSAITFVHSSLVPRPLPSFQLLPHSMQWKDGWEPGNKTTFCIEYIAVSELVSKWPRTMTILWLVQTSFHSMEPVSLNSLLSVCIYSLQRKTRLR